MDTSTSNNSRYDAWASWLLERRFGGDPEALRRHLAALAPIRDRVLDNAAIRPGQTLLDLGSGDGLIAFAALDRLGAQGSVIFSDISRDLLDHARRLAEEMGVQERCRFVEMSADDMSPISDSSIERVTTRSVLIYVDDKQRAFDEIHRVLVPGGRFSIYEPVNAFDWPEAEDRFLGIDITPIRDVADNVKTVFLTDWPSGEDSMLTFDERDLVRNAEQAGFAEIHATIEVTISPIEPASWDTWKNTAWHPRIPTVEEAMLRSLSPAEREVFVSYYKPRVERGDGRWRACWVYLWALK